MPLSLTQQDLLTAFLLGTLQGIAEWLPISSEALVAVAYSFMFSKSLDEAVGYALWIHLGTSISALIFFRQEIASIARETFQFHTPSPLLKYLVVSTIVSGITAIPLLIVLKDISNKTGSAAMIIVGLLMLITGSVLLAKPRQGDRYRGDISIIDGCLAGIAQGMAILPGLSRSGLTLAVLLARRTNRQEALTLSFIMSIPAGIAAAIYQGLDKGFTASDQAIAAAFIAAVVGLVSIKSLLRFARRVNLGGFVIIVGVFMTIGAVWQITL